MSAMHKNLPEARSACSIGRALDLVGDRWTLLILRDVLLAGRRSFSEFARAEGIATNVLAERLDRLERAGVLTKERDPEDGRRRIYLPTERGWELAPAILELAIWGRDHCGGTAHAELIELARADRDGFIAALRAAPGGPDHSA